MYTEPRAQLVTFFIVIITIFVTFTVIIVIIINIFVNIINIIITIKIGFIIIVVIIIIILLYLAYCTASFEPIIQSSTKNVLIEIWCLILSSYFLLQWYTQKDIMLASFRFVSYRVTSFSSLDFCAPSHEIEK